MKKIFALIIMLTFIAALCGCNMQVVDTTWSFDKAIVALPNGEVVEGKLNSWKDYENSDQLQVKIDGKTYLTHSQNVVMIAG